MKNKLILIPIIFFALCSALVILSFAHSGRTDANGGHWDHSTGEYHYHHGYPAHQHPLGFCPYKKAHENIENGIASSYTKELKKQKAVAAEMEKGLNDGANAGTLSGTENGKKDGLNNNESSLPTYYYPLYSQNSDYTLGSVDYQFAYRSAFEIAYNSSYESSYKENQQLWQKQRNNIIKAVAYPIVSVLILCFIFWRVIVNRKEKKRLAEEKAKQEQIAKMAQTLSVKKDVIQKKELKIRRFLIDSLKYKQQKIELYEFRYQAAVYRQRYEGKSYNQLLDLPNSIFFCNGEFKSFANDGFRYPFTVYKKNDSIKTLHSRKGCSGAYIPSCIFDYTKKNEYTLCLRCGTHEHWQYLSSYPLWYVNYLEFEKLFNKYNINRKKRKVTICLPDAPQEPKYIQ